MKELINNFVETHDSFDGKIIPYEEYLNINRDSPAVLIGGRRAMQSLISVSAWTTSADKIQKILYLSTSPHMHCAKVRYKDGTATSPHTHNYVELLCVLEGNLTLNIAGKKYAVRQGEICLVNTDAIHFEYLYAKSTTVFCLGIDDSFFSQYDTADKKEGDYTLSLKKLINQKRSDYLYICFSPVNRMPTRTLDTLRLTLLELMDDLPGKKRLLAGFTERIVDLLVKEYQINIMKADKKLFHTAVIESVCQYIQKELRTATVHAVSKEFNYNPDYINRLFKREKGISLSNYIQQCRMHRAFELLLSTDLPVETIARQSGYHNIGFFYQKFKKAYLATPYQVRLAHRQKSKIPV